MKRICKEFKYNGWVVEVWEDDFRKGDLSPRAWYFKHGSRWITEFERRVRKYPDLTMQDLFSITYSDYIVDLVYDKNPFLELIPKTDAFEGAYIPVPINTIFGSWKLDD